MKDVFQIMDFTHKDFTDHGIEVSITCLPVVPPLWFSGDPCLSATARKPVITRAKLRTLGWGPSKRVQFLGILGHIPHPSTNFLRIGPPSDVTYPFYLALIRALRCCSLPSNADFATSSPYGFGQEVVRLWLVSSPVKNMGEYSCLWILYGYFAVPI